MWFELPQFVPAPSRALPIAAALILIGSVSQVSAAIVDITYTGQVSYVLFPHDEFGSQVGDAYVVNYRFNTDLGTSYRSVTQNYNIGGTGSYRSIISPDISSSITINGITEYVSGDFDSEIYGYNDGTVQEQYHLASSQTQQLSNAVQIIGGLPSLPASITDPFAYTATVSDNAGGYYRDAQADLALRVLSVNEVVVSEVPLPASLPMFGGALLALGAFAYRKRVRVAPFVACLKNNLEGVVAGQNADVILGGAAPTP